MYIITGGAGFIGSVLLRHLNSLGIRDIIVVDNLGSSAKWQNLVKGQFSDYMHKDRFMELLRTKKLPWPIQGMVHLGACSATTEKDSDYLMENNFHYSRDLARFALEKDIRFINASSAATYGSGELGFSSDKELVEKLRPLNMYGYSKQLFDLWLLREGVESDLASLKFFNVYGPNEYHKGNMSSVVLKLWRQIRDSGSASLFASNKPDLPDGEQKRDFVYVKDCANLISWLLLEKRNFGGILNVGTGKARSFNDLAMSVFTAMDKKPCIRYCPMPEELAGKYQNYTCADMSWLADSGYKTGFFSLEEGVRDYIHNYLMKEDRFV